MIDIESLIFKNISSALSENYSQIYVYSEYPRKPAGFPCVTIEQTDNYVVRNRRTVNIENAATVTFEVNVYSNLANGRKTQCKEIAAFVDGLFSDLGFSRIMDAQIPNLADATISRHVTRYRANVDMDITLQDSEKNYDYMIYQN